MPPISLRSALVLPIALALGACSLAPSQSGADRSSLPELPAAWSQAAGQPPAAAELAGWWRRLNDPQLDRLIEAALRDAPDLRAARARLQQARAARDLALAGLAPSLGVSAGAGRSRASPAVAGELPLRTLYDAGFDASWELDLFGATRHGIDAATAEQAASAASLAASRVTLVAEVARNYVELRAYQQRLAIAGANLASQDETLAIVHWRHRAGLASELEVEQASTAREQTRAGIPDLQNGRTQAEHRLAVLLGRPPGSLRDALAATQPLPGAPEAIATGIPADVLRQRPDLIAAERTLAAETARLGQKRAARWPSLTLDASFGWQAYSLGALGGGASLARSVAGSLAATLFDGGRLRSQVAIQDAVQQAALVAYESSVLTALEEVENALAAQAVGRERLAARRAAAGAARRAAALARQLYEAGLADFQKVLDTERSRLTAEDSLATAESSVLTSLIQLYKALGGGWQDAGAADPSPKSDA